MTLRTGLWVALVLAIVVLVITTVYAQNHVPCRYIANGSNITISCANGFWQTITPDGEVFTGNGTPDPNATAQGSGIVINPGTGGPMLGPGGGVTAPTQQLPMLAPHQAESFGFQPRLD